MYRRNFSSGIEVGHKQKVAILNHTFDDQSNALPYL